MLAQHHAQPDLPDAAALRGLSHVLILLDRAEALDEACPERDLPERDLLLATLARRRQAPEELAETPLAANTADGALRVWLMLDPRDSIFTRLARLRAAFALLLDEAPLAVDVLLQTKMPEAAALAGYVGLANGVPLPHCKRADPPTALARLTLHGCPAFPAEARALAEGNLLARSLVALPANALTPDAYRQRLAALAAAEGWTMETFDLPRLRTLGAGAFLAVAQGSPEGDAAIVRLRYAPPNAHATIALAGKGICFDSGGHQLKAPEAMAGMHEDMAGSASAVGLLLAASRLGLPLTIDAWLAIARNDLSPRACRPGDIVTALDGTSIEIVDTDAEGRLVLADTLLLARRQAPALLIDFGTLTYTMIHALGCRYAGIFARPDTLAPLAVAAGQASGERVCILPMDEDYDEALDSTVADVRQCGLDDDAPDHILAARFLQRFAGDTPWLHVDLSSARCEDGLGAIASAQTGFGVAWGLRFLQDWLARLPA